MSKTSKILDQYLFAPARYLDYHGNIVDAGRVQNFISRPSTKIGALAGVVLAVAFAAANDKDFATNALSSAAGVITGLTLANGILRKPLPIYFDTTPDKKEPLHPTLEILFENRQKFVPREAVTAVPIGVGAVVGTAYMLGIADTKDIALFSGVYVATSGTNSLSEWWRVTQALNGEWNATFVRPKAPRQAAPVMAQDMAMIPAPSR